MKKKNQKKNILTLRNRIDIELKYYYGESISNIAEYTEKDRGTVFIVKLMINPELGMVDTEPTLHIKKL